MKALFCTDGSKISYNAFRNFAKYANANTVIDIICVIDWSFLPDGVIIEDSGFVTSCRDIASSILEHSELVIKETGLAAGDKIKLCGAAVESILEKLDSKEYDIVIMGSHGKKGLQRWLGSVSSEILEDSDTPAYISKEEHSGNKVLFTTDGSEISYNIAKEAISLLNLTDKEIYICTVTENPDLLFLEGTLDTNWMMAIQSQQEIYSERAVNSLKKLFEENNLNIAEKTVLSGIPAQGILDYAFEKNIDLIIAGSKAKSRMKSFLLDSTSKRVVENAKSDVFIVKIN